MFNIYKVDGKKKEYGDILKHNWDNWKKINHELRTIFFPINKEFEEMHLKEISGGACKLYLFLGLKSRNTGESWYSVKNMAEALGVKSRTIDNWIRELEDRGLIVRDRQNISSTTYLIPYSLNIIDLKIPLTGYKKEEILSKLIERVEMEKEVVGNIHRIYHLFQWEDINSFKTVQALVVITKKSFLHGKPVYTCYLTCDSIEILENDTDEKVIDAKEIINTRRFSSWYEVDKFNVIGIALENNYPINRIKVQKDAIIQLSEIPSENILEIKEVGTIDTLEFFNKYRKLDTEQEAVED